MKLQTKIALQKQSKGLIDYNANLLLLGSCFSENIGEKLNYYKFQTHQNPFGILFQPKAIEKLIQSAANAYNYTENDIFSHNEQWHCFDAHSKLSNSSKAVLLDALHSKVKLTKSAIENASHVVITLGTAWIYHHLKLNTVVANCHKVPQNAFKKSLLSVDDIAASLNNILRIIQTINSGVTVIFTVSPVRHLKDGFVENTQSKAHLIAAIHEVITQQSLGGKLPAYYFPSYEIMMDELRDYRFYGEDMVHPNQTAINYIWEKFKEVWVLDSVFVTMQAVDTIQKSLKHKPFNPNSQAHQTFLKTLNKRKAELLKQYPKMRF